MATTIRVTGLPEAIASVGAMRKVATQAINAMAQIAYDNVERGAARHRKTGNLQRSLFNAPNGPLSRIVGHNTVLADYAEWVVYGARPHLIFPKKAKALRWFGPRGNPIFAKFVRHPGYIGDNYVTRAAVEAIRQFPAIVDAAVKEAAK
jgi:hypothetical protein